MTEAGAQKAVLISFAGIAGTLLYEDVKKGAGGRPPFRQLVALTVMAAAFAAGAAAVPEIAGPLALLIALGFLVSRVGKGAAK